MTPEARRDLIEFLEMIRTKANPQTPSPSAAADPSTPGAGDRHGTSQEEGEEAGKDVAGEEEVTQ